MTILKAIFQATALIIFSFLFVATGFLAIIQLP
jgi:hypothetical protein